MRNLNELNSFRLSDLERNVYGGIGNGGNGVFKIHVEGRSFLVIASDGGGWEHVSVSPWSNKRKVCPTWDEMCAIKDLFFKPEETVVQYHPRKSNYVNNHPYCLHLWRPNGLVTMPTPPAAYV